eukprot:GFUD01005128.1.p1 GENE.GFUD01005128.1~~GFUD01005128.1.p1  ORF type:complete len:527 (-),score=94.85 GFUD01005128.1:95-1675(-)
MAGTTSNTNEGRYDRLSISKDQHFFITKKAQEILEVLDEANHNFMQNNTSSKIKKSYFNENELKSFLQKAYTLYVNAIKSGLEETCFAIPSVCRENTSITVLDTGSIPEKFGMSVWNISSSVGIVRDHDMIAVDDSQTQDPRTLLKTDHDLMFILEDLIICNNLPNVTNFCLEIEPKSEPGSEHFVQIYTVAQDNTKEILKNTLANDYLLKIVEGAFFTEKRMPSSLSKRLQNFIRENLFGLPCRNLNSSTEVSILQEGPSVNMKVTLLKTHKLLLDCDFLLALPLECWPSCANEWITRTRKWPSQDTVKALTTQKCYVVAKPRFPGDDDFWRISFSKQELDLAKELPEKARHVYLRLKVLFKKKIKLVYPEMKTYHMKTAFYWWMEEQDPSQWEETNPTREDLLESLIQKVKFFIMSGNLPHYFIPTVNLLPVSSYQRFRILTSFTILAKNWIKKVRTKTVTINSASGETIAIKLKRRESQTKAPKLHERNFTSSRPRIDRSISAQVPRVRTFSMEGVRKRFFTR